MCMSPSFVFINKDNFNYDTNEHMPTVKQHAALQGRKAPLMLARGPETTERRDEISSPSNIQIGGLRTDSFNTFPVPDTGDVPVAFDYCKNTLNVDANLQAYTGYQQLSQSIVVKSSSRMCPSSSSVRMFKPLCTML